MGKRISTAIVPRVRLSADTPRQVASEVRGLLADGAELRVAGEGKRDPAALLRRYTPRLRFALFDAVYYLSHVRQNPDIRFLVAWVLPDVEQRRPTLHPRIFYKDVSLVWRSATHFVRSETENWIGKGEVRPIPGDEERCASAEETTDLPLEIQDALEEACRIDGRIARDDRAIELVLRRGPDDRIEPYQDFTAPRRRAAADPRNRVNGGRPIARFTRELDPESLKFTPGYEPDFQAGLIERSRSHSKLYGGAVRRFRILSKNRRIQYLFLAGPRQVWIIPPQATTSEISSYGLRTIDVIAPDDLCVPGYEYHFMDDWEDPPALVSQIPAGYAGAPSPLDDARADASPWLERLGVVRDFRRVVLKQRSKPSR